MFALAYPTSVIGGTAPAGVDVFSFLFPVFVLAGLATAVII